MDQIWRKNKLNNWFEKLNHQAWKSRRREKKKEKEKKAAGTKLEFSLPHAPSRDRGVAKMFRTLEHICFWNSILYLLKYQIVFQSTWL
jgi:hypothetical protein